MTFTPDFNGFASWQINHLKNDLKYNPKLEACNENLEQLNTWLESNPKNEEILELKERQENNKNNILEKYIAQKEKIGAEFNIMNGLDPDNSYEYFWQMLNLSLDEIDFSDLNGDGTINYEEFCGREEYYYYLATDKNETIDFNNDPNAIKHFNSIDFNKDGKLDIVESTVLHWLEDWTDGYDDGVFNIDAMNLYTQEDLETFKEDGTLQEMYDIVQDYYEFYTK